MAEGAALAIHMPLGQGPSFCEPIIAGRRHVHAYHRRPAVNCIPDQEPKAPGEPDPKKMQVFQNGEKKDWNKQAAGLGLVRVRSGSCRGCCMLGMGCSRVGICKHLGARPREGRRYRE